MTMHSGSVDSLEMMYTESLSSSVVVLTAIPSSISQDGMTSRLEGMSTAFSISFRDALIFGGLGSWVKSDGFSL